LKLSKFILHNKRPSSTKERIEIRIFRFLILFSKIYKIREGYRADKMEERAELYPTPMSMLKEEEEKFFQKYFFFLCTR